MRSVTRFMICDGSTFVRSHPVLGRLACRGQSCASHAARVLLVLPLLYLNERDERDRGR